MRKIITFLLALSMLACLLVGCQKPASVQEDTTPISRKVTVLSRSGKPVEQATVKIYKDAALTDMAFAGKTDGNGSFSYTAPSAAPYYAVLSGLPAGLAGEESYPLANDTEITLKMAAMSDGDMAKVTYALGDAMMDFTVTDPAGESYTLSELLEDKDAVVLNFWFMGCAPCKNEFPHLQAAYEQYSDRVAVLALNCVDSDNQEISKFQADNGYSFVMTKADARWARMFGLDAYPTTVVINRYGEIVYIHTGAMDTQGFVDLFEAYTGTTN